MPVEIVWSPLARARLREIHAFIAMDKPEAAERLATRIVALIEALRNHPHLGRTGSEPGIRELVIGGTPYIVLYRMRGERITIIPSGMERKRGMNESYTHAKLSTPNGHLRCWIDS